MYIFDVVDVGVIEADTIVCQAVGVACPLETVTEDEAGTWTTCNTLPAGISADEKGATLSNAGGVIPVVPFNVIVISTS